MFCVACLMMIVVVITGGLRSLLCLTGLFVGLVVAVVVGFCVWICGAFV